MFSCNVNIEVKIITFEHDKTGNVGSNIAILKRERTSNFIFQEILFN